MGAAILVENVSKSFQRHHAGKPVTLMEAALSGFRQVRPIDKFWALRGVCFEVAGGEMVGVIGHNGAGKSTLLQLLGKVAHPTEGVVKMRGRLGALLDLGAGFHGDLTGRENLFVTAIVAGLTRREVSQHVDKIISFAELEAFIDHPVRTYSSGMLMRLAFSIAVHTNPDILLVDEFLSVGDLAFQAKCMNRIADMKEKGCAIVFVSHDVGQVEQLCDRVLWLKQGTVVAYGEPAVVVGQYTTEMRAQTQQRTPYRPPELTDTGTVLKVNENRFGSLEVEVAAVRLSPRTLMETGDPLYIEIDYQNNASIETAIFSVSISHGDGRKYLDVNTLAAGLPPVSLKRYGTIRLAVDRLDLSSGNYFVDIGIYEHNWSYAYDYHWHVYPITVTSLFQHQGALCPPMRWEAEPDEHLPQPAKARISIIPSQ